MSCTRRNDARIVVSLEVVHHDDGGWPALDVPCGFYGLSPECSEDLGPAPATGDVELSMSVRMAGGALVEARSTATLTPF